MYKERLHAYFQDHLDELLEDISTLVSINSEDMEPEAGIPLAEALPSVWRPPDRS